MAKQIHGAYINARYSTDNQNPDSIEVQVEKCTEWCKKNNLPVLGVFADEAVSGMKDTRPQYEAMMRNLRLGMADTVVIYDQSRMFRKMTAWFNFRDELESMGVRVVSVTQPLIGKDLRDPTNFLTEGSMALFNQIWALQTRQKVMEKMRFMAKNHLHTGGVPPLGYRVVDGKLEICKEEADTVRRIFSEYAAGKSYKQIISGLNADGLTTRNGRPFGSNSLHDILHNEKYIGVLVYGKTPRNHSGRRNTHAAPPQDVLRFENAVPVIIPVDTWEEVQIKMRKNKRDHAGRPATVRDYPLKGKVFCGECGSAMTHTATKSGQYHYYACSGKHRLHNCDLKNIKMDELEKTVVDAVRQLLSDRDNLSKILTIMRTERDNLQSGSVTRLKQIVRRREEIAQQLDNATNAILSGLTSQTLITKVKELETEKVTLDAEMLDLRRTMDATAIADDQLEKLLQIGMERDSVPLSIVVRVEVFNDHIDIYTLLDIKPDGPPTDRHHFSKENMLTIDGVEFDSLADTFTEIVGTASPAPQSPNEIVSISLGD